MKIVGYLCSLLAALICAALFIEFTTTRFLPDAYRGYLIEHDDNTVTWSYGPFEPAEPSKGFNTPVNIDKPENTLRILTLGDSMTEGWLTAKVVFQSYGQTPQPNMISSYSRVMDYSINEIATEGSKDIEVINLGIAAYNVTDVLRMLKSSMILKPDLLVIQLGTNETWTAERSHWSTYLNDDIPYFGSEAAYEVLAGIQSNWTTLSAGGNPFNPLALFTSQPLPIKPEPAGRAEGLESRLANYNENLAELGKFLKEKQIPAIIMIPAPNIAGIVPYGSVAKPGTTDEQLSTLNTLLLEALADEGDSAKARYLEILQLDDGIAEAHFQLGKIYLAEGDIATARQHFWQANDKDFVMKRPPSDFNQATRDFANTNKFPLIDVNVILEADSKSGLVDYSMVDDEVHPNRPAQFLLGTEVVRKIIDLKLLPETDYVADLNRMPDFGGYNAWTGFDPIARGTIAYLKAMHNYLSFGRFRTRINWDPRPEQVLDPVLDNLTIAIDDADIDTARYFSLILNVRLQRQQAADELLNSLGCESSVERGARVNRDVLQIYRGAIGPGNPELRQRIVDLLNEQGCTA